MYAHCIERERERERNRFERKREGERELERPERVRKENESKMNFFQVAAVVTHEMVFFSVVLTSGRALLRILRRAAVLALIREWR